MERSRKSEKRPFFPPFDLNVLTIQWTHAAHKQARYFCIPLITIFEFKIEFLFFQFFTSIRRGGESLVRWKMIVMGIGASSTLAYLWKVIIRDDSFDP